MVGRAVVLGIQGPAPIIGCHDAASLSFTKAVRASAKQLFSKDKEAASLSLMKEAASLSLLKSRSSSRKAAARAAAAAGALGCHAHAAAPLSLPKSRAYWRMSGVVSFEAGARTPLYARAICAGRSWCAPFVQPPRDGRRPRTSSPTDGLLSSRRRGCRRTAAGVEGVQLLLCSKEWRRQASGRRCLVAVTVWQPVVASLDVCRLVCRATIASAIASAVNVTEVGSCRSPVGWRMSTRIPRYSAGHLTAWGL